MLVFVFSLVGACGDTPPSAAPSTMPSAIPPAHESTDPRPGRPSLDDVKPLDAGAPDAAPTVTLIDHTAPQVTNVDSVVAGLRPRFRTCVGPKAKGKLTLHLELDEQGAVSAVTAPDVGEGITQDTVKCLSKALKTARFAIAPPGDRASVDVPLQFPEDRAPRATPR